MHFTQHKEFAQRADECQSFADERPELKHNRNVFTLDKDNQGKAELEAGDMFLHPYWMGRYLV